MTAIHQKTHFKAAISVSQADSCCVKVEPNEFSDTYAEMARNIENMNRSMIDISACNEISQYPSIISKKGPVLAAQLDKDRNCKS